MPSIAYDPTNPAYDARELAHQLLLCLYQKDGLEQISAKTFGRRNSSLTVDRLAAVVWSTVQDGNTDALRAHVEATLEMFAGSGPASDAGWYAALRHCARAQWLLWAMESRTGVPVCPRLSCDQCVALLYYFRRNKNEVGALATPVLRYDFSHLTMRRIAEELVEATGEEAQRLIVALDELLEFRKGWGNETITSIILFREAVKARQPVEQAGDKTKPGSDEAIAAGCMCPVIDNGHGQGSAEKGDEFLVTQGCPIHDPQGTAFGQTRVGGGNE